MFTAASIPGEYAAFALDACCYGADAARNHTKFALLLQRGSRLLVHGDVTPTRQYLYAGDIVDVLDIIFHKGIIGQIHNIASKDEISNIDICHKLLELFELPHSTPKQFNKWVEHTEDRPFNDHRYEACCPWLAAKDEL